MEQYIFLKFSFFEKTFLFYTEIYITISDFTSVCPSVSQSVSPTLRFLVISQNVTKKSSLACAMSEKYVLQFTLRPLGLIRQGKAELHTLHYQVRQSRTAYIKNHFSISSPSQCWSQAVVCVSTPRIYLQNGYFLIIIRIQNSTLCIK